jgi:hypothetical protein
VKNKYKLTYPQIMKKLLTLAIAAFALASCEKEPGGPSLAVSPAALSFAAGDTSPKTVAVTTKAREWKADTDTPWITLSQEGAALTVSVNSPNIGTAPREGIIGVTAGRAEPVMITVTQEATQTLSVSPASLTFAAGESGYKSVTVTTNASDGWKASWSADWFEVSSASDGRLVVTVEGLHYGSSSRSGGITITAGNAEPVTLNVTQAPTAYTLTISPSSLEFGATETGSKSVSISTNAPGGWEARESTSWFSLSGGGSTSVLTVTVTEANTSESPRSGTITVTAGTVTRELTVTQSGSALAFGDIKYGTYSATGTPSFLDSPGPRSWSGTIRPVSSGQYYELTNFGGVSDITVQLKFDQGKIYMDGVTKVAENDNYNGYFRAYYEEGIYWTIMGADYQHPVAYDKANRTLTFGSYITTESSRPQAELGVVAIPKSGNNYGVFTDLYTNLQLKLTFSSTRAESPEPADKPTTGQKVLGKMKAQ